jgi:hypothetical protein
MYIPLFSPIGVSWDRGRIARPWISVMVQNPFTDFENKFSTLLFKHLQTPPARPSPVSAQSACYRETGVGSTPAGKITPR